MVFLTCIITQILLGVVISHVANLLYKHFNIDIGFGIPLIIVALGGPFLGILIDYYILQK